MKIQAGFMSNLKNIKSCTQAFDGIYSTGRIKDWQNTTVSNNNLCASSIRRKGSRGLVDWLVKILVVCKGEPRQETKY